MEISYLVLRPFIGSGEKSPNVLRFKQETVQGADLVYQANASAGDVVRIQTAGIYSVSAALRFQHTDEQGPVSNGWGVTLNSPGQAERNVINMPPANVLAKALLPEPGKHEEQREPLTTLSWVGFLKPADELRVESERPKPRSYQGIPEDSACFLRVVKLWDVPAGSCIPLPIYHLRVDQFSAGVNVEFGKLPYGQVLHNAPPYSEQKNAVEYKVSCDCPAHYRLDVKYAAAEARPVRVLLNGSVVKEGALADTTGGWDPKDQQWRENQATLTLVKGVNVLRLERDSVFPHISEIELVQTPGT